MYAKYCPNKHPRDQYASKSSRVWKRLQTVKEITEQHIRWIIGKGEIDVRKDIWLDVPVIHMPNHYIAAYFFNQDGTPNQERMVHELSTEGYYKVCKKLITISSEPGRCNWNLTINGNFSFSSAWHLIRQKAMKIVVSKFT